MNTPYMNERKPDGWSLVAGKFKGTEKTYFYLIRGGLLCDTPLTLQCPAAEDGYVYSNPFTIESVLVHIGAHVDQETVQKLGRSLPAKRDLKILVGDELRNTTASHLWNDIICVKNSPKLREAVGDWQRTWIGDPSLNKIVAKGNDDGLAWIGSPSQNTVVAEVKNAGGIKIMDMNAACTCKNEGMGMKMSPLGEVLFYWHDEVHDRIGEIVGKATAAVRKASAKKGFVERMAAEIVEFERQGGESTAEFEAMAARRAERLRSLLMDWVEVPKVEADQVRELDQIVKDARDLLEREFESLFVRAKVVRPGDEIEWLRAVGVYGENGDDFDIEKDARRFIRAVSDDSVEI
jgi:hypothetical protein